MFHKKQLFRIIAVLGACILLFCVTHPRQETAAPVYGDKIWDQTVSAAEFGLEGEAATPPVSKLHARAACLMEWESGRVLLDKKMEEKLPMASTTKIMTAILVLENIPMDQEVTFSKYAASMPDVQLNARQDETFYVKDLLYSLLLESHNDTAVALAEAVSGSVEAFAEKMNEKAGELGCTGTHFVTPNGLDDPDHYSCAKDLCLIASYALHNDTFCELIRTASHTFRSISSHRTFAVYNHDSFLTGYQGALGIKTGFTSKAGYCFVGAARRNGMTLVGCVLSSGWPPNKSWKYRDTTVMMDYGFQAYHNVVIQPVQKTIPRPVRGKDHRQIFLKVPEDAEAFTYPLQSGESILFRVTMTPGGAGQETVCLPDGNTHQWTLEPEN